MRLASTTDAGPARPIAGPAKPLAEPDSPASAPHAPRTWPDIAVFATVRNEEAHLRRALDSVLAQEYPGRVDVVLSVGPSRDNTYGIAVEMTRAEPRLRIVENRTGLIPDGLNAALAACPPDSSVLVRFDGHTALPPGYLRAVVRLLEDTGADNVGGRMVPRGGTLLERAIAVAMSSPVGIGPAPFHVGGEAGPSDTAYLGAFRRTAIERVGGFDEFYERAEDWELNLRIRRSGGLVWFDPALEVEYRPRSSWKALAKQFWSTGQWRREVVRRNPTSLTLRYVAPPAVVSAILAGTTLALLGALVAELWLVLGALAPTCYVLGAIVGALVAGRTEPWAVRARLVGVLAVMHMAWGAGFLRGTTVPRTRARDARSSR